MDGFLRLRSNNVVVDVAFVEGTDKTCTDVEVLNIEGGKRVVGVVQHFMGTEEGREILAG